MRNNEITFLSILLFFILFIGQTHAQNSPTPKSGGNEKDSLNKSHLGHWGTPLDNHHCKVTEPFAYKSHPTEMNLKVVNREDFPEKKRGGIIGDSTVNTVAERWVICSFEFKQPQKDFLFITSGTTVRYSTWDGSTNSGGLGIYFYRSIPKVGWGKPGTFDKVIPAFNVYGSQTSQIDGGTHEISLKEPSRLLVIGIRFVDAWRDTSINFEIDWNYIQQKRTN